MKTHITFTPHPIVIPAAATGLREIGAVLEFSGLVRAGENGRTISGLHYEAHTTMAHKQLERILNELGQRHDAEEVWFIHRLGFVPVGEASLYIRINARHRQATLALMGELIDRLKQDVPVWKLTPALPA
ncbi:MAG TPA: molybdenum cofactor biosynthesis protein MoaE [Verrucomicrobiae bacterium]